MTLELARKRRDQGDLIDELVKVLEQLTADWEFWGGADETWVILDFERFNESCRTARAVLEKAKEHDCIPWDDARDVAQQ